VSDIISPTDLFYLILSDIYLYYNANPGTLQAFFVKDGGENDGYLADI